MKLASLVPATLALVMSSALVSGCVIAPARPGYYGAPAGVVYVAPTYAVPAPGYAWAYHANYGWGYRHPQYGWHRGWQ